METSGMEASQIGWSLQVDTSLDFPYPMTMYVVSSAMGF